jgi:hypothetical protein
MHRTLVGATLVVASLCLAALVATASGGTRDVTIAEISAPDVGTAVAFDTTPPLSSMKPVKPKGGEPKNIGESGTGPAVQPPHKKDGALQEAAPVAAMPAPLLTFEGPSNETTSGSSASGSTRPTRTATSDRSTTSR